MPRRTAVRPTRFATVALLCAALVATLVATLPRDARAQATATAATTRELVRLEDSWAAAVVKRDGTTFERLLAPGFVYTENDQLMTRGDVLRSVTSGSDTVTAAHNEGMVVHSFGPATAVVTGWLVMRGRGPSGAFDRRYRFTDTWVKSGGRWRIVAAQDYLAPAGGK
jgi:hypothetical protein